MKLAQARLLANELENKLVELYLKRTNSKYIGKNKGADKVTVEPEGDVEKLTIEIDELQHKIITLKGMIATANATQAINFKMDDKNLTIVEALALITHWRKELQNSKELASTKPYNRVNDLGAGSRYGVSSPNPFAFEEVFIVNFNTKHFANRVEKLNRLILRLEGAIQEANWVIEIPFEEE